MNLHIQCLYYVLMSASSAISLVGDQQAAWGEVVASSSDAAVGDAGLDAAWKEVAAVDDASSCDGSGWGVVACAGVQDMVPVAESSCLVADIPRQSRSAQKQAFQRGRAELM